MYHPRLHHRVQELHNVLLIEGRSKGYPYFTERNLFNSNKHCVFVTNCKITMLFWFFASFLVILWIQMIIISSLMYFNYDFKLLSFSVSSWSSVFAGVFKLEIQIKVSKFINKNSSQKGEQIHRRTRILLKCDNKLYNFHIYKKNC